VRLAPRSGGIETKREVLGGTPTTAVEPTALPTDWISEYSRLFESIRGSMRKLLICRVGLTQVVDFHDISTYFHVVPLASMAGSAQVAKGSETAYASC
jgi:hypothetical protein